MPGFSFEEQTQLLKIAIDILTDYNVESWSFGGGTALSAVYYNHRMSYDIDIFTSDFSSITNLIDHKETLAESLEIDMNLVEVSPGGITFILSDEGHQLKLDFLYANELTKVPYKILSVLGQENIKVQTPFEIIAKKMKFREIITIRDFVDFAFAEQEDEVVTKVKESGIIGFDRFIDIWNQFEHISDEEFNLQLTYLNTVFMSSKNCIKDSIYKSFNPSESISIAINEDFEFLTADIWIEEFREDYESVGEYNIYENISKLDISKFLEKDISLITYNDINILTPPQIKKLLKI